MFPRYHGGGSFVRRRAGRVLATLLACAAVVLVACGGALAAPLGVFNEFRIPTAGSGAGGIAAGPDGDMWFIESQRNKIGRVTPSGVITEFPIPPTPTGGNPVDITAGPDGNMWFLEAGTRVTIGRITPSGVITQFPTPAPGGDVRSIAAGPDHNLWFTGVGGNHIGLVGDGPPGAAITKANVNSRQRRATFRFKAVAFGTGFQCALVKLRAHHAKPMPRFSGCTSPTTYKHLIPGKYTFDVRALDAASLGTPASASFKIS